MTASALAARALAEWTVQTVASGKKSVSRQQLPPMDLEEFLRILADRGAKLPGFDASEISLALVGFGGTLTTVRKLARDSGLAFGGLAVDLHRAAKWRNKREDHPVIVAFAHGRVAGVNTLKHFPGPTPTELAGALLDWAQQQPEYQDTPAQRQLIEALQEFCTGEDSVRISFEQLRQFLAAWTPGSDPRQLLAHLGLLPDPNLFTTSINDRLALGIETVGMLRDRRQSDIEGLRKRLKGSPGRLSTLANLIAIRRDPSVARLSEVTLDEARNVFRGKADDERPDDDEPVLDDDDEDEDRAGGNKPIGEKKLQAVCTEALLDNREEELERNAAALSSSLRSAIEDGEADSGRDDEWTSEIEVEGQKQQVKAPLDRGFVSWIHHFCSSTAFGGLIETGIPDLRTALVDYDRPETLVFDGTEVVRAKGEWLSMKQVLQIWDEEIAEAGQPSLALEALWDRFITLRGELLQHLDELAHIPLQWFAGKADDAARANEYLRVVADLMAGVQKGFPTMMGREPTIAKDTLQGLLALDVLQVRVQLENGKYSSKAVILPMHPLHLWRYSRLSRLLPGLGNELSEEDRKAVVKEACEPVQFLGVIYASRLPGGRGAGQVLPVSNELHRLATFENLRNSYNGPDGIDTLFYAVQRFAAACRRHVNPLRIALVNPPEAGRMLLKLFKLLDGRRKDFLPKLRVEVFGTTGQKLRLRNALAFDTKERELIEEKIAAGKLDLVVHREPKELNDLLDHLKQRPVHIAAIFDEAPVSVRRGGAGLRLPMSPFCIRRKVQFQKRLNEMRLEVTSGDPPFYQFMELVKTAEGVDGEGTPYAFTEAESLRNAVDRLLTGPDFGAHWLLLADRALPDESGMTARRLLRKREGQRQILLAARDYSPLVRLMLPVFATDIPNLLLAPRHFDALLAEGAHLVGAGLLEVVKSQEGIVSPGKVIGLTGALLAARAYRKEHPDALIVSTDSQLARTWLRLGTQGERCDMLALREQNGDLVMEAVEVKTAPGAPKAAGDPEIVKAITQLKATLEAVSQGVGAIPSSAEAGHCLAAPRNEMLKEVLVAGCMAREVPASRRKLWAGWLDRLFGDTPVTPELRGLVVDVALGSAEDSHRETLSTSPHPLTLFHLTEPVIEELLILDSPQSEDDSADGEDGGDETPPNDAPKDGGKFTADPPSDDPVLRPKKAARTTKKRETNEEVAPEPVAEPGKGLIGLGTKASGEGVVWEVKIEQNPHLMVVGQPGTGKTTALVNICRQLSDQGIAPIVFSYHDDIDEELRAVLPGVTFTDASNLGFNPMEVMGEGERAYIDCAGQLRDIFAAIFHDLGELQLGTLYEAFKRAYEDNGWNKNGTRGAVPRFGVFLEFLQGIEKPDKGTKTLLTRLTELEDRGFFDADSPRPGYLDTTTPVVLQLHTTRSGAAQTAFASFAFYRLYQDMFRRGRPEQLTHAIIFDEAHRAAKLSLIPTMAKECRKFGISLILASQEASDFAPELFAAIDSTLVLRVTDESARQIAKNKVVASQQRDLADRMKQLPNYEALAFGSQFGKAGIRIQLSSDYPS
jgi:hypothetical protein